MTRSIYAAILGASGYGAGELLRLFTQHPEVEVVSATSTSQVGEPLERLHPHLRGFYDLRTSEAVDFGRLLAGTHAALFSALPGGASGAALHAIMSKLERQPGLDRLRVIDLSGDFRLTDARQHTRYYPDAPLLPEWRGAFVYGMPELSRAQIRTARYIANPGCLAIASILAAAPLASAGYAGPLVIDAKTGSSGAGRQLKETTHHPTRHADFRAYEPLSHRHEPEIRQALGDPQGERIQTSFVAHSMDTARGIFVTLHATLPEAREAAALYRHYTEFYAESPFVRIVAGSPALQNVVGSNFCDIGLAARERQVIVMAALDNLVKGMAGTAVQNLNLMCGLPETTGLWAPALRPV
jgi:N-acetyl-gamma-glutamyl-phosphate/LysW-gamma-L-alpha-aminoadipyl-6-phosphate reductase